MGEEVTRAAEDVAVLAGNAEPGVLCTVLEGTGEGKGGEEEENRKDTRNLPRCRSHGSLLI